MSALGLEAEPFLATRRLGWLCCPGVDTGTGGHFYSAPDVHRTRRSWEEILPEPRNLGPLMRTAGGAEVDASPAPGPPGAASGTQSEDCAHGDKPQERLKGGECGPVEGENSHLQAPCIAACGHAGAHPSPASASLRVTKKNLQSPG